MPTPIGHVANTPEIVAAFEAAVKDGMDVINFSGGGPEVEPSNDALIAAVHAVAAAGVVPVIAAGNDRDDFGDGTVGSPGTAPDAITVAAVSNTHVFAPALDVTGPVGRPASPSWARTASARRSRGDERTGRSWTSARSPARTDVSSSGTSAGRRTRSTALRERCRPRRWTA